MELKSIAISMMVILIVLFGIVYLRGNKGKDISKLEGQYFEALKLFSEDKISQDELTAKAVSYFRAIGKDEQIALSMVNNDISALKR